MQITFICGCSTGEIIDRQNLQTMTNIVVDDEGMLTCFNHHARRYGWRALPKWQNEDGNEKEIAWFYNWFPSEIEGYILFGEIPARLKFTDLPGIIQGQATDRALSELRQ